MQYVILLIQLAFIGAMIAGIWKVFEKAGEPGWAALVPIYNLIVLLRIAGKPWWWIFLILIPFAGIVFAVLAIVSLARSFGKGTGFAVGLLLLGFIFYPMLGFGPDRYLGPDGQGVRKKVRSRRDDEEETEQDDFEEDEDRGRRRGKARSRDRSRDEDEEDEEEDDRERRRRKARRRDDDYDDETEEEPPRKTTPVKAAPPPVPARAANEPTVVQCPGCNKRLRVPANVAGKKVKCPECGNAFVA